MHFEYLIQVWHSLEFIRRVHDVFELGALAFFGALVILDTLAHFDEDLRPLRAKNLEKVGLICFAVAVFGEMVAYEFSRRGDFLSDERDRQRGTEIQLIDQKAKIASADANTAVGNASEAVRDSTAAQADSSGARADAQSAAVQAHAAKDEADSYGRKIASALRRAEEAENHLTEALNQAASANKRALQAQRAFDEYRAGRSLNEAQRKRLSSKLPARPLQGAVVQLLPVTVESGQFASQLLDALKDAWPQASFSGIDPSIATEVSAVSGVVVFSTPSPRSVSAADALVRALQDEGFSAAIGPHFLKIDCDELHRTNPNLKLTETFCSGISIVVGPKP